MIRTLVVCIAAALSVAGCETAPAAERAQARTIEWLPRDSPQPERCDVRISFGSFCCGTPDNRPIIAALERDRRVEGLVGYHWGREGESTLCVATRSAADREAVVRAMIPLARNAGGRGSISIHVGETERFNSGGG